MSEAVDDLIALMPHARRERVFENVFFIIARIDDANDWQAAIDTLRAFGSDVVAYYVYDTFDDLRIRITFRASAEPLIYYADRLRGPSLRRNGSASV